MKISKITISLTTFILVTLICSVSHANQYEFLEGLLETESDVEWAKKYRDTRKDLQQEYNEKKTPLKTLESGLKVDLNRAQFYKEILQEYRKSVNNLESKINSSTKKDVEKLWDLTSDQANPWTALELMKAKKLEHDNKFKSYENELLKLVSDNEKTSDFVIRFEEFLSTNELIDVGVFRDLCLKDLEASKDTKLSTAQKCLSKIKDDNKKSYSTKVVFKNTKKSEALQLEANIRPSEKENNFEVCFGFAPRQSLASHLNSTQRKLFKESGLTESQINEFINNGITNQDELNSAKQLENFEDQFSFVEVEGVGNYLKDNCKVIEATSSWELAEKTKAAFQSALSIKNEGLLSDQLNFVEEQLGNESNKDSLHGSLAKLHYEINSGKLLADIARKKDILSWVQGNRDNFKDNNNVCQLLVQHHKDEFSALDDESQDLCEDFRPVEDKLNEIASRAIAGSEPQSLNKADFEEKLNEAKKRMEAQYFAHMQQLQGIVSHCLGLIRNNKAKSGLDKVVQQIQPLANSLLLKGYGASDELLKPIFANFLEDNSMQQAFAANSNIVDPMINDGVSRFLNENTDAKKVREEINRLKNVQNSFNDLIFQMAASSPMGIQDPRFQNDFKVQKALALKKIVDKTLTRLQLKARERGSQARGRFNGIAKSGQSSGTQKSNNSRVRLINNPPAQKKQATRKPAVRSNPNASQSKAPNLLR